MAEDCSNVRFTCPTGQRKTTLTKTPLQNEGKFNPTGFCVFGSCTLYFRHAIFSVKLTGNIKVRCHQSWRDKGYLFLAVRKYCYQQQLRTSCTQVQHHMEQENLHFQTGKEAKKKNRNISTAYNIHKYLKSKCLGGVGDWRGRGNNWCEHQFFHYSLNWHCAK